MITVNNPYKDDANIYIQIDNIISIAREKLGGESEEHIKRRLVESRNEGNEARLFRKDLGYLGRDSTTQESRKTIGRSP